MGTELISTKIFGKVKEDGLKMETVLEMYTKGKITLWKAAELAGLSLWEMLETIKTRKMPVKYDLEEAKEDLKLVLGE